MSDSSENFDSKDVIKALESKQQKLEDKFNQADQFAQHLINTLKKSKEADEEIKKIIRKLIKEDKNCNDDIKEVANQIYKQKSLAFQKEFWWKILNVFVLPIIFLILGAFLNKWFGK